MKCQAFLLGKKKKKKKKKKAEKKKTEKKVKILCAAVVISILRVRCSTYFQKTDRAVFPL